MKNAKSIPIIDVFAGPGGLGEGFSAYCNTRGNRPFKIALSIEKDAVAHQTLLLRSFFRQFEKHSVPDAYYQRLRQQMTTAELLALHPRAATIAGEEAWNATLGDDTSAPLDELRRRVRDALRSYPDGEDRWLLIGGPPCQAYSLVGRSRNRGKAGYRLEDDPRARLYLEYLQIIGDFWPAVFVMENVRGLLSARFDGESVIDLSLLDYHGLVCHGKLHYVIETFKAWQTRCLRDSQMCNYKTQAGAFGRPCRLEVQQSPFPVVPV